MNGRNGRAAAASCTALALALALGALSLPPVRADDAAELAAALDRILAEHGLADARVGVSVVEVKSGRVLVDRRADEPITPASSMKVLVSAAALARLGPGHELRTTLSRRGAVGADGALRGDLVITGGGDPNISGRFVPDGQDALIDAWAAVLTDALGVTAVTGDVVADDRLFDAQRIDPTWDERDLHKWYAAEVSALGFNDNCVDVVVSPGEAAGQPARVRLRPDTGYLEVVNRAVTTTDPKRHVITLDRPVGTNKIVVGGKVLATAQPFTGYVTVPDPSLFFATLLREALERRGVTVGGTVRRWGARDAEAGLHPVADWVSRLEPTVGVCNRKSQNLYAECLLRLLGARSAGEGSARGGAKALSAFLAEVGVPAGRVTVQDGSGLSRENRIAPSALTAVLRHARAASWGPALDASLARPGRDGTLRRRLRDLPPGVVVRAKTGTLTGVSALAGYVDGPDAPAVAFAFLSEKLPKGVGPARAAQDDLVAALAARARRPEPAGSR